MWSASRSSAPSSSTAAIAPAPLLALPGQLLGRRAELLRELLDCVACSRPPLRGRERAQRDLFDDRGPLLQVARAHRPLAREPLLQRAALDFELPLPQRALRSEERRV